MGASTDVAKYVRKLALKTFGCFLKFIAGQPHIIFCLGLFSQTLTIHRTTSKERGPCLFVSFTSTCSRAFRHLQFCLRYEGLLFLIAMHAIPRLLPKEIYSPPWISAWLNITLESRIIGGVGIVGGGGWLDIVIIINNRGGGVGGLNSVEKIV